MAAYKIFIEYQIRLYDILGCWVLAVCEFQLLWGTEREVGNQPIGK